MFINQNLIILSVTNDMLIVLFDIPTGLKTKSGRIIDSGRTLSPKLTVIQKKKTILALANQGKGKNQ